MKNQYQSIAEKQRAFKRKLQALLYEFDAQIQSDVKTPPAKVVIYIDRYDEEGMEAFDTINSQGFFVEPE